jgi:hypothetical protein
MKFATERPYADPEAAARKLIEIANSIEAVQEGRIHIEKINGPFLFEFKGSPPEYGAGLDLAIARGWLVMHESGTLREVHTGRRGFVCVMRFRFNTVAPETAEHFDQRFTAYSWQLAHRLHFSVALLALAGIPDLLRHPAMICAKTGGTMKILSVRLRLKWRR